MDQNEQAIWEQFFDRCDACAYQNKTGFETTPDKFCPMLELPCNLRCCSSCYEDCVQWANEASQENA